MSNWGLIVHNHPLLLKCTVLFNFILFLTLKKGSLRFSFRWDGMNFTGNSSSWVCNFSFPKLYQNVQNLFSKAIYQNVCFLTPVGDGVERIRWSDLHLLCLKIRFFSEIFSSGTRIYVWRISFLLGDKCFQPARVLIDKSLEEQKNWSLESGNIYLPCPQSTWMDQVSNFDMDLDMDMNLELYLVKWMDQVSNFNLRKSGGPSRGGAHAPLLARLPQRPSSWRKYF